MKLYYNAITKNGKRIEGFIDAKDKQEAARYLQKHQLMPIKIVPPSELGIRRLFNFIKKSYTKDLIFFTRQLASMLTSGLTLMQALVILRDQMKKTMIADSVQSIVLDVENGKNFSSAIDKYRTIFSPIYISLIKTGEASGLLDKILLRLADNLEKDENLRQTIRSALLYPIIIVIMMIVVTFIMMIFVIPQLSVLYGNLNVALPIQTVIVIGVSNFFVKFWPLMIIVIPLAIYGSRRWYKSESGRKTVDKYILKIPVFGKLMVQAMMAEFSRTFGLLISSGSLVVDSLNRSAEVVGNIHYKSAIQTVSKRVEKGITVSDALNASVFFPPYLVQMVKIGEQTGKLDEALLKASEYYEREVEQTVKTLTTLMEPIIMVVLAVGVGFLIFAVITPIYGLLSNLQ